MRLIEREGRNSEAIAAVRPLRVWVDEDGETGIARVEPSIFNRGCWWTCVDGDGYHHAPDVSLQDAVDYVRSRLLAAGHTITQAPEPTPAACPDCEYFACRIPGREQVAWFARVMERKLRANDHKGGWDDDSWTALFKRLQEEAEELRLALGGPGRDVGRCIDEAADVANFAMMIADNLRGGTPTAPSEPDEGAASPVGAGEAVPVAHADIGPGFWRVEGAHPEQAHEGHYRVVQHSGGLLCVWGLSLWGPSGEPETWAYRTFGQGLDVFLARYPGSRWYAEQDAIPGVLAASGWGGAGEAVRPRVGAWFEREPGTFCRNFVILDGEEDDPAAFAHGGGHWSAFRRGVFETLGTDQAPTLDAAMAAADAALEAAGYVLEGGAHVDPGAVLTESMEAQRDARLVRELRAEVERLTADLNRSRKTIARMVAESNGALDEWRRVDEAIKAGDGPVSGEPHKRIAETVERLTRERERADAEVSRLADGLTRIAEALGRDWSPDDLDDLVMAAKDTDADLARLQDLANSRKATIADLDTTLTTIRFALGDSPNGWTPPAGVDPVVDLALRVRQERDDAWKDEASVDETLASTTRERDQACALLDRIAKAAGIPCDWRELAGAGDDLVSIVGDLHAAAMREREAVASLAEARARLTEWAEHDTSDALELGRVRAALRCEAGTEAAAALALVEQAALARGEVAGLERAIRTVVEVGRG